MTIKIFPLDRQLDMMDCGPASLKMVAKYYGKYYSLQYLRDLCGNTKEGVSLAGLSHGAEAIGIRTLAAHCTTQDVVDRIPLPIIIHWNNSHFVVLYDENVKRNGETKFCVADPARGYVEYDPNNPPPITGGGVGGVGGGNSSTGDPWKRVDGELAITSTNDFSDKDYTDSGPRFDEVSLKMQKVTIKGANGENITAYRVVSYIDSNGVTHYDVPDEYKSNCHGSAMGLDLWIDDPYNPNAQGIDEIHEDLAFQNMMNTNYSSNSTDSTVISFYNGDVLAHSIRRDPATGKIWSKTDIEGLIEYDSLADFYDGNNGLNRDIYENLTKKYYDPQFSE